MSTLTLNVKLLSNVMTQGYDDSYGDSYYSQIPTGDKKYECRTGPFEGFFVISVEFCKHFKFDDKDRKENRTGTQGPPGPQGPAGATGATGSQGIQGIEGPSGLNQLNLTKLYFVEGTPENTAPYFFTASCEPGDFVLGGGLIKENQSQVFPRFKEKRHRRSLV
jgi:hypothetical protein